jgi:AcrR family transcriptional regulator
LHVETIVLATRIVDSRIDRGRGVRRSSTEPRKSPRQARARATLDAILTAAAQVLEEVGYERANVNRIAERAGVSIGSLYQYFPTKEALVAAVIQRHSSEMIAFFQRDLPSLGLLPPREAIREIVRRSLQAYAHQPKLRKVIQEEVPRVEIFLRSQEFDDQLAVMCAGYLEFHRAHVRPTDHALAVKILTTAVEGVARRFVVEDARRLTDDDLAEEVTQLVARYLLREDA